MAFKLELNTKQVVDYHEHPHDKHHRIHSKS